MKEFATSPGSPGKAQKVSMWRQFWFNRRHYQLHIFCAAVLGLAIVFFINFTSISVIYNQQVATGLANTVVFTPSTTTSLSNVPIQVMLCRVNSEKNQMFLLLKIENTKDISLNIDDYELYIANANKNWQHAKMPAESLRGQYYMFGATGYFGIYVYTNTQFDGSYKWITVRNTNPVTANRQPYVRLVADDARYDQYHLFVNPAAKSAPTIDFLEDHELGEPLDATEIYKQAISENQEAEIKDKIIPKYSELEDVSTHISEYRRRLERDYGLNVPALPPVIEGDEVRIVEDEVQDGEVESTHKEYVFAGTVPGGIDLDWMDLSLRTGYYQSFYESNLYSLKEFLDDKRAEIKTASASSSSSEESAKPAPVTIQASEWTFTETGDKIDTASPEMKGIVDEIGTYNGYLTQYVSIKTEIQTNLFLSLLDLEYTTNTYMTSARILTDTYDEEDNFIPALRVW